MKNLGNKFIENLHVFIVLYALYGIWLKYDEHTVAYEETIAQFEPLRIEIQNNTKKVSEIEEFQKRTEESKVRVEEVAKNIELVQKQLPAETNDSQIITAFNQEIESLNIKDTTIVPQSETASMYYISKPYAVKANGTFLQFLVFFERIANATRIYNVTDLVIRNTSDSQRGRFQVISLETKIEAFRFNPDFKVERGF